MSRHGNCPAGHASSTTRASCKQRIQDHFSRVSPIHNFSSMSAVMEKKGYGLVGSCIHWRQMNTFCGRNGLSERHGCACSCCVADSEPAHKATDSQSSARILFNQQQLITCCPNVLDSHLASKPHRSPKKLQQSFRLVITQYMRRQRTIFRSVGDQVQYVSLLTSSSCQIYFLNIARDGHSMKP